MRNPFLSFFLSFFLLVVSSQSIQAACPTPLDYPSVPLNGEHSYNTTIQGCNVTISYCWRIVTDASTGMLRYDYYVTGVKPTGGPCTGVKWKDLIKGAQDDIITSNPANFQMNPCGQGPYAYSVQVIAFSCWKVVNQGTSIDPVEVAVICDDQNSYCQSVAMTCKDPNSGVVIIITKSKSLINSPDCVVAPDMSPYSDNFEYNTCYSLANCE